MQVSIFNKILFKLNGIMKRKNQKIIFLINNTSIYLILDEIREKLDCINVKFLPSNTTTEFQTYNTRIIHSFKYYYKCLFI